MSSNDYAKINKCDVCSIEIKIKIFLFVFCKVTASRPRTSPSNQLLHLNLVFASGPGGFISDVPSQHLVDIMSEMTRY